MMLTMTLHQHRPLASTTIVDYREGDGDDGGFGKEMVAVAMMKMKMHTMMVIMKVRVIVMGYVFLLPRLTQTIP